MKSFVLKAKYRYNIDLRVTDGFEVSKNKINYMRKEEQLLAVLSQKQEADVATITLD